MNRIQSTAAVIATAALTLHAPNLAAKEPQQRPVVDFASCSKPHWPAADLQAKHTGTVTLRFTVSETGEVTDSGIVKSSGHAGLDEAARSGIAKCRFKPAMENGKPVAYKNVQLQYVWTLE
ncbi:energy transducer TonB [Pseudoduganella sp. OTU4001]|uniref:energy transducer TonB n=1 Tax=Pseudoduganella sp. OTU4001 TaxID=3043854 RepID=UPI00313E0982